ncbi:MAG TPA: hypothetical protein VNZ47_17520 [Candidatus Dormibacteraeota bacterium]|jgi:hypothetical protein|nr:hypothetical protein [Candidatus Dormibacteraeota bacterium]
MLFPIKVCAVCSEEFELKPDKPGFANRCPACSETETAEPATKGRMDAVERKSAKDANESAIIFVAIGFPRSAQE